MNKQITRLAISLAILLFSWATKASAADSYVYCSGLDIVGSTTTVYNSPIFQLPPSAITFANSSTPMANFDNSDPWRITVPVEPASSFSKYLIERYSVTAYVDVNCYAFRSLSRAQSQLSDLTQGGRTLHYRETSVNWTYTPKIPMRQSTSTSMEKPTEADAIFDAESRAKGPFENDKYPTIHIWDNHTCDPHTHKTSNYANAKTVTTYTCMVTYSYSDTASPVAKAALGSGATQDDATQKAKAMIDNAQWSQPFCSKTFKPKTYQSKPSYKVGDSPEGSDWWVCEVDYTTTP